ncbi:hypothetical protein [Methylobacterium sp. WL6]|uniref:hypothetical protein n=1 Tax=Methylobacterium sp. WL6 TaxID=2603901 RepID=UPI001FEE3170|nr:hypothetical protein [Methylobacterium sp. WL6]
MPISTGPAIRPRASRPVAAETESAVEKLAPSGLTFRATSSAPKVPSSARVENPVWNARPASRAAACLLTVSRTLPEPGVASSQESRAASDFTASRFTASAAVPIPRRARFWRLARVARKLVQALPVKM